MKIPPPIGEFYTSLVALPLAGEVHPQLTTRSFKIILSKSPLCIPTLTAGSTDLYLLSIYCSTADLTFNDRYLSGITVGVVNRPAGASAVLFSE